AIYLWRHRARRPIGGGAGVATSAVKRVLFLPLIPRDVYEGKTVFAETDGATNLGWVEATAIRLAYRFSSEKVEEDNDVEQHLRALIQDARLGMTAGIEEGFREALNAAIDLHSKLLRGSEYMGSNAEPGSFSLLPAEFLGRKFHQNWAWSYKQLIEDAIGQL